MKVIEKRADGSIRVYTKNDKPSMTDQSFAKDCDMNHIIRKYKQTGNVTHLARFRGQYADVSEITDLMGAYETVAKAEEAFMVLPAEVRTKFKNDPNELIMYLQDPKNHAESIELGLREKPKGAGAPDTKPAASGSPETPPTK